MQLWPTQGIDGDPRCVRSGVLRWMPEVVSASATSRPSPTEADGSVLVWKRAPLSRFTAVSGRR
jgi:hypothetical protein